MDDDVNIRRQNAMDLGSKVNSIIAEFEKTGLNSYVRLELEGEYYDARMKWDDAVTEYNEQLPDYETARQNIGLLKKQKDDLLKRIKDLLAKWKRINNFKAPLNDGLVTQRAELKDEIRFLQSQCKIAKEILREHNRSQSMGARFMNFFYSRMPNGPIE
ncbi:hypothetical protein BASA81_013296 [Batrachochytrium salamandrivorans]|nr:hypothetical protein BASA81_013296 [Batrachochytrium salamandrivorans]